ncbi:MAG: D-2-hydroxyacid dehydrogenase [Verrucomicrobia bacterium]|nr:D-2-hydroxyacid dehydrogenase [Verrucomicrobiota bacterium]
MKNASRFLTLVCLTMGAACLAPGLAAAEKAAAKRDATTAKSPAQSVAEEIGSLRNARVAIKMPAQKIELTYFAGSISAADQAELARLAPNVRIVTGLTRETALARAGEAHGIDGRFATPEFLARAPKLVWVQVMSAGVDRFVGIEPLVKNDAIVLTNFRGVHGPSIADHAMAMLLSLTRDLRFHAANQVKQHWGKGESPGQPVALDKSTMLVVGIGGIGTEIAQRAHGFGMRVIGTRRSTTPAPAFFERVGQSKDLLTMLPEADVVAIAVPLTAETEKLFNPAAFAAMKRGSYFINIARGKVVDTNALVAALKSGQLAGACLDVTDPEPLPAGHVLWSLPNVIITPHVAGESEVTDQRSSAMLRENIRRFGAGEPLLNVVDKVAGY